MTRPGPTYKRTKFCIRWRGRRWYDPNERKVIWSALGFAVVSSLLRLTIMGAAASHPQPLQAAQIAPHGIYGTPHDLSSKGPNHVTSSQEVCIFCHTPHRAAEGIKQAIPVWNHETTKVQFVMYTSQNLKGAVDPQPMGPSLACLSCHDGTIAVGALHELPQGGGQDDYSHAKGGVSPMNGTIQGANLVGRDLSSIHPISVSYRDDLVKSLRAPSELQGVRLYPSNVRGAKVQCASCHDPHNFGVLGSTAPFLRVTKQGSALCLACHLM